MDRAADDAALQPLIVLRVVIRSPDLETFVNKYSRFVKDDRIFIFTKSSQPPGTRVRFTLELADGQPLINGEGTVTRIRPDVGDTSKPPGMELRFTPLDEPSQKLVLRMLAARELVGRMPDQQTAPILAGTESQPIAISDRFRDETTDVDDDLPPPLPPRPPVIESHPVLEPLQKTGVHDAIADEPGQDESGAVTLAQGPTGARGAGDEVPSGGFTAPDALPAGVRLPSQPPLPPLPKPKAPNPDERPSGNFATPTPLPMPIPAGAYESQLMQQPHTRMERPGAALDKLNAATRRDDGLEGPAPQFAESFRAQLPGAPPPKNGSTVPANPFSEVSDGAIEYFVEWSLEQSTAPKPKAANSSFANVAMATPRAEKRRSSVRPLLVGTALGLVLGVPLGGAAMWLWKPMPLPVIVEQMPSVPPTVTQEPQPPPIEPKPVDKPQPIAAAPSVPPPVLAKTEPKPKPPRPIAATEKPKAPPQEVPDKLEVKVEKPADKPQPIASKPSDESAQPSDEAKPKDEGAKAAKDGKLTVQIVSHPSGAAITVDGEARGKTPATMQLVAGTHEVALAKDRYATATQTVDAPGKVDVTLRRPQATIHVDSDPPGGDVSIEGKPRGKAPVDVTLEAFHHYDVQVTLLGTKPFKKRVSLKPPLVNVDAKLEVVHK